MLVPKPPAVPTEGIHCDRRGWPPASIVGFVGFSICISNLAFLNSLFSGSASSSQALCSLFSPFFYQQLEPPVWLPHFYVALSSLCLSGFMGQLVAWVRFHHVVSHVAEVYSV